MRSASTLLIGSALLLAAPFFGSDALAHGGAYRGPPGEIPPGSRNPEDPPPPPAGDGPDTPGGETEGGPKTGGDDVGGPKTGGDDGPGGATSPGSGPTPSAGGPSGGSPTGARAPGASKGPGYAGWVFWWNFNKDEILQLKASGRVHEAPTGSGLHQFGNRRSGRVEVIAATRAAIDTRVVPALSAMLDDGKLNFDIQSAAAIALAKIGDRRIVPTLKRMAHNDDGEYHRVVEESAALALGLLQHDSDDVRDFLLETISDQRRSASYVRPFAAMSLGLLGAEGDTDGRVREALIDAIARSDPRQDMKPACLTALGLLGDDMAVPALLAMLDKGRAPRRGADDLSDKDLAFVVQALGRIGRPGVDGDDLAVVTAMTELVTASRAKNRVDPNVARSAAIALGQLGMDADADTRLKILKTLKAVARFAKDDSEQSFALVAIGRLASADDLDPVSRREAVHTLRYYLKEGKASLTRPYAALAMGLVGRGAPTAANEDELRQPLRDAFKDARRGDPRTRGAYAIASGLVRDPLAVESLVEVLADRGNASQLRGHSAIALGMIGDPAAREAIRVALADETDRELRVQTAIAAGLMGDAGAIQPLVDILEDGEESQYVLGSVALALGKIGDQRAIDPLLAIAQDPEEKYPDITRALATVALGQIGDFGDAPVLARVSTDINFRAMGGLPAIIELLTIL